MLRLSRRAQCIVEYVIIIAIATWACIALYSYIKFRVDQKMSIVWAER